MRLQHVRALDGVRGVAVALIVVHHIIVRAADPLYSGWATVDLFFALSGFLITQSILTSGRRDGEDGISLGEFYRRRFWRLGPALAVFLVLAFLLWPEDPNSKAVAAAAGQVLNVVQGFGDPPFSPQLAHLWSISAEVQFYVVWAFALFALVRLRAPRVVIVGLLAAAFAASAWQRVAIVGDGDFVWNRPYFSPDTRSAAIVTGCAAGLAFAWGWLDGAWTRRVLAVVTVPAVVAMGWAMRIHHLDERLYTLAMPVVGVATALIVASVATQAPSPIRRVVALEPLPFLGRISYSLYLWHLPILEQVAEWRGEDALLEIALLGIPLSLVVGTASYWFIERPLLRGWRGAQRERVSTAA